MICPAMIVIGAGSAIGWKPTILGNAFIGLQF